MLTEEKINAFAERYSDKAVSLLYRHLTML